MKHLAILITALMLCGCDDKIENNRSVSREEFEELKSHREWNGFIIKHKITAAEDRLDKLEAAERLRDKQPDITLSIDSMSGPSPQWYRTNTMILAVPPGLTLITLPDGRYALVPNNK